MGILSLISVAFLLQFELSSASFDIQYDETTLQVLIGETKVIDHSPESPFVFIGLGDYGFESHLGNFNTSDYVQERIGLTEFNVNNETEVVTVEFHQNGQLMVSSHIHCLEHKNVMYMLPARD